MSTLAISEKSSFLGWVWRALVGIGTTTRNAAIKNYNLAISSSLGFFNFFLSRETWWAKLLCCVPLVIAWISWMMVLLVNTCITPILVPVGFAVVVIAVCVHVDQITYLQSTVSPQFTQEANKDLSIDEKGALMMAATYSQMEKELDSTLGWCPNDATLNPFSHLDNRCNRQIGVWYAAGKASTVFSEKLTKFGISSKENTDTKNARLHFGNFADQWGLMGALSDASENHFREAVNLIKKFEADTKKSASSSMVNIRADDYVSMINVLIDDSGVLSEPYGGLTSRNSTVEWGQLDDKIFYAQGTAIVARDIAVALKYAFPKELARGGLDNLNAAITSLNKAAAFNPWWITRGDGSSQFADHRAKMQNYFTEAFRRLEEMKKSLET